MTAKSSERITGGRASTRKLTRITAGLWSLESTFVVWGCRGSARMVVVETASGLVLYSPVRLAPENIDELKSIGPVATIVAPNLFHHMFLRPCQAAFPAANVLVARGLEAKIGAIARSQEITAGTRIGPPSEIAHFVFDGHTLHETVLFHRPTSTLITADLLYNYGPRQYPAERMFFRAIGCYGAPKVAFYHRFAIRDRRSVRRLVDTVSTWGPRRIVMSHGDIVEDDDAAALFAAAWERFAG